MNQPVNLSTDERAAMRAFLQRSEVRISTIHRTFTALLSGAGVLVLLPAVGRDSVVNVVRPLLGSPDSPLHLTLAVLVALMLLLAFIAIWLLLYEIARFYFHANHLSHEGGTTFTPRWTLTGLHLPMDELGDEGRAALIERRNDPDNIELLVPRTERFRGYVDNLGKAYPGLHAAETPTDASRATALLQLAGVKDRLLVDEVAKVEYGMARQIIRVQVVVLRYIKAVLIVLACTLCTFVLAGVVTASPGIDTSAERWIVAVFMVWAPAVLFVSASPVRWIGQMLMVEGATRSGIRHDKDLTRLDRVTALVSFAVFAVALVCGVVLMSRDASTIGTVTFTATALAGGLAELWLLWKVRS